MKLEMLITYKGFWDIEKLVMHTIEIWLGLLFSKLTFVFWYVFFRKSRRVFLYNFILKLFTLKYVKTPSDIDGYFEEYPLFTISCGSSDDIQKYVSRSWWYDNYTLPNQFLRKLTESYFRGVHNRFWWFQQGCPSGQEWGRGDGASQDVR